MDGRRARACIEARPEGFSDKQLHVGVASVEPGTGAVRGFYGGQDYLDPRSTGRSPAARPARRSSRSRSAAGIKDGFSLKDTFEGNSPDRAPRRHRVREPGRRGLRLRVNMITATEDSINTAFIDLTVEHGRRPGEDRRHGQPTGHPAGRASRSKDPPASRTPRPGLEPNTGVALGSATVSPINMANAYATHRQRAARPPSRTSSRRSSTPTARRSTTHKVADQRGRRPRTSPPTSPTRSSRSSRTGSGTAALALDRPAAGKTGTATNDDGDVSSAWFTGYTPQLATSVMYVRGKGNEQLDGWLPSYFGGAYPAETWTAVMQRGHGGPRRSRSSRSRPTSTATRPTTGHEPSPAAADPRSPPPTKPPTTRAADERADDRRRRRRRPPTPTPTADAEPTVPPCADRAPASADVARRRRRPAEPARRRPAAAGSRAGGVRARSTGEPWWRPGAAAGTSTRRGTTRSSPRSARASAGRSASRAGRHPWWTPVRVLLRWPRSCLALGMVQKARCYAGLLARRRRAATRTCATPTCPTSTPAAGFAELTWPYSDDAEVRRPLRRSMEYPVGISYCAWGDRVGHPLAHRLARPRARGTPSRSTSSAARPEVAARARGCFVVVNALGFAGADAAGGLAAGRGQPAAALGRRALRRRPRRWC